jgi:RNA polymerase sigma-70 factor (ECF subfamily)
VPLLIPAHRILFSTTELDVMDHRAPDGRPGPWADELLVAVGRGDIRALGAFYDSTARPLYRFLRDALCGPEPAERATVEVYLQIWRAAPQFDPDRCSAYSLLLLLARRELAGRLTGKGG